MTSAGATTTVLIVDDTPANLGVLVSRLEEAGWCVLVAQDGEEAIERVRYVLPDLVLMDVRMPGIDGHETCRRMKTDPRMSKVPVVFMTAQHDPDENLRGFEVGGVDCITKPLHIAETMARLGAHLDTFGQLNRLSEENASLRQRLESASGRETS
jgi:DNA-binding response OmpR family regulator